jgi:hypothetical protein
LRPLKKGARAYSAFTAENLATRFTKLYDWQCSIPSTRWSSKQTSSLGNFAGVLADGEQSSLLENGSQMLASLVSGQDQNAITKAIAEFTGLEEGSSGSVLGILTSIIMGTIANHQSAAGSLDANGIAYLFASQKDNIAAALPSGFVSLLSGADIDPPHCTVNQHGLPRARRAERKLTWK